mgnify:CR=1 FL=1
MPRVKKEDLEYGGKIYQRKHMFYKQFEGDTQDVHTMTHRGTPKTTRNRLNVGDIYTNAAECDECGYFIRSRNRHDYVTCLCGAISVDGGSWYVKRSGDLKKMINIIELYDDVEEEE